MGGGGRELMIWKVFRRLKSWSDTKLTAAGAVVASLPLRRPKASRESYIWGAMRLAISKLVGSNSRSFAKSSGDQ